MYTNWRQTSLGFTLLEILIVLAVIGILTSMVLFNTADSGKQARDAQRQADLRELQNAIELYKNKYGEYPAQCPAIAGSNGWSGQVGTDFECTDGTNNYIVGLSEFLPKLPTDPRLNGSDSGYVYRVYTNSTSNKRTVYKIKAQKTVESETVGINHPMKPCDVRADLVSETSNFREVIGWCSRIKEWGTGGTIKRPPDTCNPNNPSFKSSYGVWGGFEEKLPASTGCGGDSPDECPRVVVRTTDVICR